MVSNSTRREFLKTSAALSLVGAASPFALKLAALGTAAAQTPDYKALVCLFLYGGNDHTNTIIPYDTPSYTEYFNARSSIAIPYGDLAATTFSSTSTQGNKLFALHPSLVNLHSLYTSGRAAVVANIGPLIVPTSLHEYKNKLVPLPPKLHSHNDQQSAWQAYLASGEGAPYGWGGTIGDQLANMNSTSAFTCISAAGNAVWLSGRNMVQYQVSTSGALTMNAITGSLYGSTSAATAYRDLVTLSSSNLFENELGVINRRSIDTNAMLKTALAPNTFFTTPIPANNTLASQMNVVARMIEARNRLNLRRQVFLVSLGGFDHHDALLTQHAQRLSTIDAAVGAFWSWLGEIGMQSNVTLFTASDFGRTLTSNGDGSDHGWGAHHFVIGGAVKGGTVYGDFPITSYGTTTDIGQGSLLPSISVDQLASTLGGWLGVSDSSMNQVLPNIGNFSSRYLPIF